MKENIKEIRYLPVPQQYFSTGSYDQITIREIYFRKDRNKFSRRLRYYFPLTNEWLYKGLLENRLKKFNLNFIEWECIWVLGLSISKIGSLEWVERKTEVVYRNKSYVTKTFITTLLLKDPYNTSIDYNDFVSRFDLINDYFETRKENEFIIDYDFSKVPDIFRKTDKIQLIYYFNGVKKIYIATYRTLNTEIKDALDFRPIVVSYANRDKRAKKFIEDAKKLHGDKYNYDYVEYKNNSIPVKIVCNDCSTIFYQIPYVHLMGSGCPNCNSTSSGEDLVKRYLEFNNIIYTAQDRHLVNNRYLIPDFSLTINNKNYWLEYNGIQHYEFIPFFHNNDIFKFKNQLLRDILERKYCKENNICLIEIPYTFNTIENISNLLTEIIFDNISQFQLINYLELYSLDGTGMNLEELCIPRD